MAPSDASPLRPGEVRAGDGQLSLMPMRDSTTLLHAGNFDALRAEYKEQGYLLLRGLIPPGDVRAARRKIVSRLLQRGELDEGGSADEAPMRGGRRPGLVLFTDDELRESEEVRTTLESSALRDFFGAFFGEEATTFAYKWMRAVGAGEFTGAHVDSVYMGRGSQQLMTAWIPLGDVAVEEGTLMALPRSHAHPDYAELRTGYGALDVDRDVPADPAASGQLTDHPLTWAAKTPPPIAATAEQGGAGAGRLAWDAALPSIPAAARSGWVSADFQAGDVVIFGIQTLHMSTTNTSKGFRLSCDTRWQPASQPVDERWAGGAMEGKALRLFCGDQPRAPVGGAYEGVTSSTDADA